MNREIKFRFWDKKKKEFPQVLCLGDSFAEYEKNEDRYIPLQYTGLKDKNGKEIYEGDICKIRFVLDDVEDYIFYSLSEEEKKTQTKIFLVKSPLFNNQIEFTAEEIEVIGNIYENPELINNN